MPPQPSLHKFQVHNFGPRCRCIHMLSQHWITQVSLGHSAIMNQMTMYRVIALSNGRRGSPRTESAQPAYPDVCQSKPESPLSTMLTKESGWFQFKPAWAASIMEKDWSQLTPTWLTKFCAATGTIRVVSVVLLPFSVHLKSALLPFTKQFSVHSPKLPGSRVLLVMVPLLLLSSILLHSVLCYQTHHLRKNYCDQELWFVCTSPSMSRV